MNQPERQIMFQSDEYVCRDMEDTGPDAICHTPAAALACAPFLNHARERHIQHHAALLNSGHVEAPVSSLKVRTTVAL
jgi:hypothetical protein